VQLHGDKNFERIAALREILQKHAKSDFDVARGISIIEEAKIDIVTLESVIENPFGGNAIRIGITGSPGVGKSTLLNRLICMEDFSGYKIAVIAIDPSSRITKGAVLGDRIRITQGVVFENIYFRSMATRGAYGGLNQSIKSVMFFLANCGFNLIFVETVGVGQNEVEIAECVDLVLHILDSSAGDDVQMEKAGVMEVGDLYFVNKRDDRVNNQFISNLKSFTSISNRASGVKPAVVVGSAVSGEGFDEIIRHLNLPHPSRIELGGRWKK
jgi:LAO/AO transport system kinase